MSIFLSNRRLVRVMLAGTVLAGLGGGQAVWAQAINPAPQAAADEPAGLAEIVVTAQRRSENVQKVPISVNAFSGTELKRLSITEPKTLQFSTPGLTFPSDNGTINPYIRGRGTGFSGPGLEGSVAIYVDDVYQQSQFGTGGLVDVSQVQVLKGPQGTLYGRNATGGAIVISTNNPTHDFNGFVEGGYGSLNAKQFQGMINVPISETLAVRVAGKYEDQDGFVRNVIDGKKHGGSDRYQVRVKALWNANDRLTALLSAEYQRSNTGYLRTQIVDGTGTRTNLGFYETEQSPRNPDSRGGENNIRVFSSTLRLDLDLDNFSVTSITGYRATHLKSCSDNDNVYPVYNQFCINHDASPGHLDKKIGGAYDRTFSEEVRANSKFDGFLNFAIGANYQRSNSRFPAIIEGLLFGPLLPTFDNFVKLRNYSVFGEAYFDLAQGLKLTVGGRYSKDERKLRVFNNADLAIGFGIPPAFVPATFGQKVSFETFTPRAVLAYDTGDANYYVSFNKGFKSGGFNVPALFPQVPLKPEKIDGYEAGAKFKMLDNRLRLDIAYFRTKSSNVQVASIDTLSNSVVQQNAAGVKADGFEANLNIAASDRLTMQIGAAYLHSRFTSFPSAAVYAVDPATGLLVGSRENLKGFATTNSPDFTANANATYNADLWNDWKASVTVSARYTTGYDLQAGAGGPLRADRQKAFGIANLTGDLTAPGGNISVSWYVNNLFKTHYYDIIQTGANFGGRALENGRVGGTYAGQGLTRTYGAALRYTF